MDPKNTPTTGKRTSGKSSDAARARSTSAPRRRPVRSDERAEPFCIVLSYPVYTANVC